MASQNFVVHNGLTVGPTTIDAATGDIVTSGNISVTGGGSFGGIEAGKITNGTTDVTAYENDAVGISVAGTANVILVDASGVTTFSDTTDSSDFNAGAVVIAGGLAVAANLHIGENLHIAGNLEVNGTQTIFNTNNASFNDGMIYLADGNAGDVLDLGFLVAFDNGTYQHGGMIRDASDSEWYLFEGVTDEPTTTVNMAQASYSNLTLNILTGTATNAQYADLAEMYSSDAEIEPGTVVHFGGTAEVSTCDADHCTRVAGVVSTHPAHLMNKDLVAEHKIELALTGRVPCKVTGAVAKGDMMVSAGNGRARAEANPRVGAVIGKALENWEGGEGVIEVVVGKH